MNSRQRAKRTLVVAVSGLAFAGLVGLSASAAPVTQNAVITQTSPDYVYWEAEWFDRIEGANNNTWSVNFFPNFVASNPNPANKTILAPDQANNNNPDQTFAKYKLTFNSAAQYTLYAFRLGGGGDSMFPPPAFNQQPHLTGTNQNRWNSIAGDNWSQLGVTGDYPATTYFATGSRNYEVTDDNADNAEILGFSIGAREDWAEYDRFVLHKTVGLTANDLNALTRSAVTISNPVAPPPPVPGWVPPASAPKGGVGKIGIREVVNNGNMNDQNNARTSLASGAGTIVDYEAPMIDIFDSDKRGHWGVDNPFAVVPAGHKTLGNVDHIALVAQGYVQVPEDGVYTFGIFSDDGFTLQLPGRDFTPTRAAAIENWDNGKPLTYRGGRGGDDSLGTVTLTKGPQPFILTYHEGGGGSMIEFFAAKGDKNQFDADFRPIGYKGIGAAPKPGLKGAVHMIASAHQPGLPAELQVNTLAKGELALEGAVFEADFDRVNHTSLNGPGGTGLSFPGDLAFPNDLAGVDEDDFGVRVTGTIEIPASGLYQIGYNGDDGAALKIAGATWNSIVPGSHGNAVIDGEWIKTDALTGWAWTAGELNLAAGDYPFELVFFERGSGAGVELFGRGKAENGWGNFEILVTGGAGFFQDFDGLQVVPEPGTLALIGLGSLALLRRRRSRS